MPPRYKIKQYLIDGVYHVYNRGVEKREIFLDEQDYAIFLHLLKYYLSPVEKNPIHPLINLPNYSVAFKYRHVLENLEDKVDLFAFCLMPNHFHLIIRQKTVDGMTSLMRKISTTYAMYFNKKYDRVGYLFQGNYKAILVDRDDYLIHLSRYVHINSAEFEGTVPSNYPYSSYSYYLKEKHAVWLKPDFILNYFKDSSYKDFVEAGLGKADNLLGNLVIE